MLLQVPFRETARVRDRDVFRGFGDLARWHGAGGVRAGKAERGEVDDAMDGLWYGVADHADRDAAEAVADQDNRAVPAHALRTTSMTWATLSCIVIAAIGDSPAVNAAMSCAWQDGGIVAWSPHPGRPTRGLRCPSNASSRTTGAQKKLLLPRP